MLIKFLNDITLVGVGIISENRIRSHKQFQNLERWQETKKVESENKPRGIILWKKKSKTKSGYVAKQQTTQSSRVTAGQNINEESTIWLMTA